MKEERLPVSLDPIRFAKLGRVCRAKIKLSELPRLSALVLGDEPAEIEIVFSMDKEARTILETKIKTEFSLVCQRCLEVFKLPVSTRQFLTPVRGFQEAELLPDHLDPFWMEGDLISPLDLIEEDLLLEIPLIPMHSEQDCPGLPKVDFI